MIFVNKVNIGIRNKCPFFSPRNFVTRTRGFNLPCNKGKQVTL